jgi:hypothetical protein
MVIAWAAHASPIMFSGMPRTNAACLTELERRDLGYRARPRHTFGFLLKCRTANTMTVPSDDRKYTAYGNV